MAPLMTLPLTSVLSVSLAAVAKSSLMWLLLAVNPIGLPVANAQDTQYISDMVLVPVRSGAARSFVLNRGLPSGTALLVLDKATTASGQKSKPAVARVAGFQPSTSRKSRQRGF